MSETGIAYAICGVGDIPNRRARSFSLMRVEADPDGGPPREIPWHIFVVRWDRKVRGYVNRCPHHNERLDWEADRFLEGERLVCGKHGSLFDLATGACVEGPCLGSGLEPVKLAIVDGDICTTGVVLAEDADDVVPARDAGGVVPARDAGGVVPSVVGNTPGVS